jgi:hypothetical protein
MSIPAEHSLKGQKQSIIQQNGVGLQGSKKGTTDRPRAICDSNLE